MAISNATLLGVASTRVNTLFVSVEVQCSMEKGTCVHEPRSLLLVTESYVQHVIISTWTCFR